VFLDTNVLVSAFATRGLCADVLRLVLAEHTLVTGEVVLRELRRILRRRIGLPPAAVEEIDELLREQDVVAKPPAPASVPERDPDDRWVVASAVVGRADVLVTGDRDLLDLATAPVRIVDPRGFWDLVRKNG
jgi:putative PIN family toxin of toxin-antitoxin system